MTVIINGTTGITDVDGSAATPALTGTDTNTGIFFPAADTIAFAEGGSEAMRIDSSGNVGIGTASPSYKLDITGQGRATTGFAVSADGSTFTPSGLNAIPNYGVGYITSTSQTVLSGFGGIPFYTNQVERMRIDSSGNVGIGTASPTQRLQVHGSTGSDVYTRISNTDSTTSSGLLIGLNGNEEGVVRVETNQALIFGTNNTERMRIAADGVITSTLGGMQLISGTAVASTSGTSIDFTGIPSWVKRITVMFNGVSTNGATSYLVQGGNSGGIVSTGYVSTSIQTNSSSGTGGTTSTAGFVIFSNSPSALNSGLFVMTNVSGSTWVSSHLFKGGPTTTNSGGGDGSISTLTRVRITTVNGTDTFDAGSINILYE